MEERFSQILEGYRTGEGNLITLLQDIQAEFGYVPEEAVTWFSKRLDLPESKFFGVATFYSQFYLTRRGKYIITACCGTACHVKGAERLMSAAQRELNLQAGQETTEDGEVTLEKVACLGTCSMAPVVVINKKMYGKITPEKLKKEIRGLRKAQQ